MQMDTQWPFSLTGLTAQSPIAQPFIATAIHNTAMPLGNQPLAGEAADGQSRSSPV
jgi:hypothetical protein